MDTTFPYAARSRAIRTAIRTPYCCPEIARESSTDGLRSWFDKLTTSGPRKFRSS